MATVPRPSSYSHLNPCFLGGEQVKLGNIVQGKDKLNDVFHGNGKLRVVKLGPWKKINMSENPAQMLKLQ